MGAKKDKKKKQGRGAEKTLAKTAKNAAKRERKDRKAQGADEEDIEEILNNLAKADRERVAVTEVKYSWFRFKCLSNGIAFRLY